MPDDMRIQGGRRPDLREERIRDVFEKLRTGNPGMQMKRDRKRGVVTSISKIQPKARGPRPHATPQGEREQMSSFLEEQPDIFGLCDSRDELNWEKADLMEDKEGDAWLGVRQRYKGIPVHGAGMWAWFSRDEVSSGRILGQIRNKCVPDIDIGDATPNISAAEAVGKAQDVYWPEKREEAREAARRLGLTPETEPPQMEIVEHEGFRLCYVVKIPAAKNAVLRVMTCYVDALTGEFLFAYDGLRSSTRIRGYYSTEEEAARLQDLLDVDEYGDYVLVDSSRPGGPTITIYSLTSPDAEPIENGVCGVKLEKNDIGQITKGPSKATARDRKTDQRPEVDALIYAGQIVDYFLQRHGWNGFNDRGHDVRIGVHWGTNMSNACFDTHKQAIYLGDGDGEKYDFWATKDVIAHEYTHGIINHTAGFAPAREKKDGNLEARENCSLEEAFAYIFALLVNLSDAERTGDLTAAEEIGSRLFKGNHEGGESLAVVKPGHPWGRNHICSPPRAIVNHYLQAWDHRSGKGFASDIDCHRTMGIVLYAAYLIIKGGSHPRSHINVVGIGNEEAERLFFRALTRWIGRQNERADFMDCRSALCNAVTRDLHKNCPASAHILESVKNAFTAVGIGPDLYIPCNDHDDGTRHREGTLPDESPCIDFRKSDPSAQRQQEDSCRAYDIYVTVCNRGTNPDATEFTLSVFWENPDGASEDTILMLIGSKSDSIAARLRSSSEVGDVSKKQVGPIKWPADRFPDRSPVRVICVVDGDDDPAPETELIRSVDTVDLYLKNSNNFAWKKFALSP